MARALSSGSVHVNMSRSDVSSLRSSGCSVAVWRIEIWEEIRKKSFMLWAIAVMDCLCLGDVGEVRDMMVL